MILLLLASSIVSLLVLRAIWQQRTAARIKIVSAKGIDSLEKIKLGGVDQWILIRGWNRNNPVLLLMHGGPGFPCMPFAHVAAELEKRFVVVHWDQRGAGKSYSPSIPASSMNMKQFVADTLELTDLLRARFNQPRILLGAHSWGSMIAALAVAQAPERFSAYLAVSQAANAPESERLMYRWALEKAAEKGNQKAISQLKEIGSPPYERFADYNKMTGWIGRFSSEEHQAPSRGGALFDWPLSRHSTLGQIWCAYRWGQGLVLPSLARSFLRHRSSQAGSATRCAGFLFLGRHDHTATASAAMAERYFQALDAPRGKRLIWFENSGHWPQLEESERFQEQTSNVLFWVSELSDRCWECRSRVPSQFCRWLCTCTFHFSASHTSSLLEVCPRRR